ncbi:glycosyltransferase [Amycolatopsis sp. QT-25]|uniref:glycosyltransferase n=1 Tax=Amycolatopsis sp. QT-25 TaxID=3034022 RepID=UPI0023EC52F3|nr:glycosyltransferase [Amycolatopsis sp. QT-25]WET76815.1 glycosyltransferase [Amycolatopsis sp. QT-25]
MIRVLALTSSGLGHLFPMVPSLWAARCAGATVLVGATGPAVAGSVGAGIPAVDLFPDGMDELSAIRASFLRRMPGAAEGERFALAMRLFAALSDRVADAAVALGRAWRPDVVLHTALQPAGPLVAAVLGVPAVEHGFQLTGVARTQSLMEPHLAQACERHGVPGLRDVDEALDVCPPSMFPGGPTGLALGYRPYGGARALDPAEFTERPGRRRALVTLGTMADHGELAPLLLRTLAKHDLDVLVAGELPVGTDPDSVLAHGWLPLETVLPGCDVLVHHGGAGSTLAALSRGVPQVIVSRDADHAFNGEAITRRGAGVFAVPDGGDTAVLDEALDHVLHDPRPSKAAREVAEEIAGLPGPEQVVPDLLTELTTARRREYA